MKRSNEAPHRAQAISNLRISAFRAAVACLFAVAVTLLALPAARAADLLLIGGQGNDVSVAAAAVRMQNWKSWEAGHFAYALAGEWQVGVWDALSSATPDQQVFDGSFTSVLSLRPNSGRLTSTYLEFGFGLHLLSTTKIDTDRHFGCAFQFGEFLGVGADLGSEKRYSFGVRVQHVSNGGICSDNDGITFAQALLQYRF
jgi:lipid A 3-O-deacylase